MILNEVFHESSFRDRLLRQTPEREVVDTHETDQMF